MRNLDELLVSVCKDCHAAFVHNGNHPINVFPGNKMTNPADYLTSPDGFATCVSCHSPHAPQHDCRMRFQYRNGGMKAGAFSDIEMTRAAGGCLGCHSSKGVLPKNRK